MFEEGNILYFNPFYFENGNTPKPKYFMVLKNMEDNIVLASLPTSHDHIPGSIEKIHGCIDDYTINFNCYYFKKGQKVAHNEQNGSEFCFPKDTYVYGYRIEIFNTEKFNEQIASSKTRITFKGKLYINEMEQLYECLRNSSSVKRKFRKILYKKHTCNNKA